MGIILHEFIEQGDGLAVCLLRFSILTELLSDLADPRIRPCSLVSSFWSVRVRGGELLVEDHRFLEKLTIRFVDLGLLGQLFLYHSQVNLVQRLHGQTEVTFRPHALAKGPVLIGIYKSSCQASKAMFPFLQRLADRYGDKGLSVFGIAQDSANITRSFARRLDLTFPILVEGRVRWPAEGLRGRGRRSPSGAASPGPS